MLLARRILFFFVHGFTCNALVNAPLFSLGASGKIGGAIVYSKWKGRDYARKYVIPANPRTLPQIFQRGMLKALVTWWHNKEESPDNLWAVQASAGNFSFFNAYCKYNLDRETNGAYPVRDPSGGGEAHGNNGTITATATGPGALDVTVTGISGTNSTDLLLITLGTASGANTTADSVHRTLSGVTGISGTASQTLSFSNIPAGAYYLGLINVGQEGSHTSWAHTGSAVTIIGS